MRSSHYVASRVIPDRWLGLMDSDHHQERAEDALQELGLKEYEAKSFVALSRMPRATAKEISETTDVPRTRVYDAVRVLEAKGLVEIQHSNPQHFRAVPIEEAVDSLEEQYQSRMSTLRNALEGIEPAPREDEMATQEVWALSGSNAIATRTGKLLEEATEEVVLVVGSDHLLTEKLLDALDGIPDDVDLVIGALTEPVQDRLREELPEAKVFVSGLEWLHGRDDQQETAIGRLLLIDRETILVSSFEPSSGKELAVFGRGFSNGLVVIARRLMATGLLTSQDPK